MCNLDSLHGLPYNINGQTYRVFDLITDFAISVIKGNKLLVDIPTSAKSQVIDTIIKHDEGTKVIFKASKLDTEITEATIGDEQTATIQMVILPNNIVIIGDSAFEKCNNLREVLLSDSLESIGKQAFKDCYYIANITIPNNVTSIGNSAFDGCSGLTEIVIPDRVTSIGNQAFLDCTGLTDVTIGAGVVDLGSRVFGGCISLSNIIVAPDNLSYKSIDGNLYNNTENTLIQYAIGKTDEEFMIADNVVTVGSHAFRDCTNLCKVIIPNGCEISNYAFSYCSNLSEVLIKGDIKKINSHAFAYCTNLTKIIFPGDIEELGASLFRGCSNLEHVDLGNITYNSIPNSTFTDCTSLQSVVISDYVATISGSAFAHCNALTTIYYKGTETDWNNILINSGNVALNDATLYYYSEAEPAKDDIGRYWHYNEAGEIEIWTAAE